MENRVVVSCCLPSLSHGSLGTVAAAVARHHKRLSHCILLNQKKTKMHKFKVQFLQNAYSFCTIVKIKKISLNYYNLAIICTFFLVYNCFTMLHQILLYNKVNQLYVHMHPLPLKPPSAPPSYPTKYSQRTELSPWCIHF